MFNKASIHNQSGYIPFRDASTSRYLKSQKSQKADTIVTTFFENDPFRKYSLDKSVYNPLVHQPPREVKDKKFIVVEQKIQYGKAISKADLDLLLSKKSQPQTEIVTYGRSIEDIRVGTPFGDRMKQSGPNIEIQNKGNYMNCC